MFVVLGCSLESEFTVVVSVSLSAILMLSIFFSTAMFSGKRLLSLVVLLSLVLSVSSPDRLLSSVLSVSSSEVLLSSFFPELPSEVSLSSDFPELSSEVSLFLTEAISDTTLLSSCFSCFLIPYSKLK